MRVYVNNEPVDIFEGARICDALNKYCSERFRVFDHRLIRIFDYQGNIIFHDGSLSECDRIFFTEL